jgi:hypothetical protein
VDEDLMVMNPVVLLRAQRPQAVPILGWSPEFLDGRDGGSSTPTWEPYFVEQERWERKLAVQSRNGSNVT